MKIIDSVCALRAQLQGKKKIAFVPTMGNLHAGHLSLLQVARCYGKLIVVSIFINPLQFGLNDDFSRYPRTLAEDIELLKREKVDILFVPTQEEILAEPLYRIRPPAYLGDILEGKYRPGFFEGVCTVIMRLFNCVRPYAAVFGKKDYQQWVILREMKNQCMLPIQIIVTDTVRDSTGLALSSRNRYLTDAERAEAPRLFTLLSRIRHQIDQEGRRDLAALTQEALTELNANGWQADYILVCKRTNLTPPTQTETDSPLVLLAAAKLGNARLIDNLEI